MKVGFSGGGTCDSSLQPNMLHGKQYLPSVQKPIWSTGYEYIKYSRGITEQALKTDWSEVVAGSKSTESTFNILLFHLLSLRCQYFSHCKSGRYSLWTYADDNCTRQRGRAWRRRAQRNEEKRGLERWWHGSRGGKVMNILFFYSTGRFSVNNRGQRCHYTLTVFPLQMCDSMREVAWGDKRLEWVG